MKDFQTWQGLKASFPGGLRLVRLVCSYRERNEWLREFGHRDLPSWRLTDKMVLLFEPVKKRELLDWLAKAGER